MLGDDVVGSFDVPNENVTITDVDPELVLDSLVDMDAGFDVEEAALVSPVRVEGEGNALRCGRSTFQRSGSYSLRRWWMQRMMRLAVSPGWVAGRVRGDGFPSVWAVVCIRNEAWQAVPCCPAQPSC